MDFGNLIVLWLLANMSVLGFKLLKTEIRYRRIRRKYVKN